MDFAKFYPSEVVKNLKFDSNFQHHSKFLDFAKFHPSHVWSGQKTQISAKKSKRAIFPFS